MKFQKPFPQISFRSTVVLISVFVLSVFVLVGCSRDSDGLAQRESTVYDKVISTGTIRVAYVVYPPAVIKDPNTNELSGIFVETLEETAKNLGVEIDWTEEVGWGTMIEGLLADRYDLVCAQVWPNATRAKLVDFSRPLYYSGVGVYVRNDDDRFTGDLQAINQQDVKIATVDGEMTDIIARSKFPDAKRVSLPQLSDLSQILLNVVNKKADVTFIEPYLGTKFREHNPGTVKNITEDRPIRVFPNSMMFKRDQMEFKNMLNVAIDELANAGFVDDLIEEYAPSHGLYHVAPPYEVSK